MSVLLVEVWVILDRPPNDPLSPQGGSLHQLLTKAKECSTKQRSFQLLAISENCAMQFLVDAPLMLCPENDPRSCTLSYDKEPGDHIGFHYDTSYYQGKH